MFASADDTECVKSCASGRSILAENELGKYYRCLPVASCNMFVSAGGACVGAGACKQAGGYAYLALGTCDTTAPDLKTTNFNSTYEHDDIYKCVYNYPYLDTTSAPFRCVARDSCSGYLDRARMLCVNRT